MTYLPNIPAAPDAISQSQIDIQQNFQQLNVRFGIDHNEFDDLANSGMHKQVNIPAVLPGDPVLANPAGMYYTKAVAAVTQAFFSNGTTVTQLSGLPQTLTSATGTVTFAGGLILKWGFIATAGTNLTVVNFVAEMHTNFPNNLFNVQLTTRLAAGDTTAKTAAVDTAGFSTTGFNIVTSSQSINSVYWLAIGN